MIAGFILSYMSFLFQAYCFYYSRFFNFIILQVFSLYQKKKNENKSQNVERKSQLADTVLICKSNYQSVLEMTGLVRSCMDSGAINSAIIHRADYFSNVLFFLHHA